ncbi:hypothetical protein IAQ61_011125 [Plenodomus lingam]|uniref:DUF8021 domain-containing protein n=1 Tax=Leptosphaeria maculans (strain JN3 / isolate v23.1.3 / race Av1-4-5-6-7-8) TaxID=985895 RepID=E5A950_LEPMJ|nr:hypothetical protein LEMA_P013210.1 [Plenodomus lingam JN3]KAH9859344.1 hypothetical protein IAQ61_011125 [Plenodomus lingam]CBY00191.1 hypothetical protein LEMA_P013210.1 [Plenodomus lingam JN3]
MRLFSISILAISLSAISPSRATPCEREFLASFTSLYLSAQALGTPSLLTNTSSQIASNFSYTENFLPRNLSAPTSILSTPLNITTSRSILDPDLCSAFTEIIVTNASHPYVIGVRAEGDGKAIWKVETLVSDAGDWLFNATGTAYWNSLENWQVIPADQRDTREVIKAAGDAYFDRFGNASVVVPFGTPCARLEGGAYTDTQRTNTSTCALGLPSTVHVVDRRYVVDVEMGTVNIYVGFPGLDRASEEPAPDSHTFRVEKGMLRYIHTISTCDGHPGCGLNGTYVPLRT